jgi:hypothetical protein
MKTSDSISSIAPALVKAQAAMGVAHKSATNPHFKSKYADLPAIVEAVKGPLNETGITFLQGVTGDSTGVMVTTRLLHVSGEWIEATIYMPVTQSTPQAFGSAITYCRRYGLQSLVGLPADDDDGNAGSVLTEKLALSNIAAAKSLANLQTVWEAMPVDVRKIKSVAEAKAKKKADFLAAEEEHAATV